MSSSEPDCLRLLQLGNKTGFLLTSSGRIERVSDPDRSAGPRLNFSGCAQGNAVLVRYDVPDSLASKLLAAAAQEPPWGDPERDPACAGELIALLSTARPVTSVEVGVNYRLPNAQPYAHGFPIVRSNSAEGAMLAARFAKDGMPTAMIDAGFRSIADLWPPWCIARERDDVASIAFAARLADRGAAIGVYTFPEFRGRGFAAAVTAAWSSLAILKDRVLFYGARRDNRSSRRVIERLKLPLIGGSLRID
jgi:hypothetical protein